MVDPIYSTHTLPIVHVALLVAVAHPPRDRSVHERHNNLLSTLLPIRTCVSGFLCITDRNESDLSTNRTLVRVDVAVEAQIHGVRLAPALQLFDRLLRHRRHLLVVALVPLALVLDPPHVVTSLHRIALIQHPPLSIPTM